METGKKRYAHVNCPTQEEIQAIAQISEDRAKLEEYVKYILQVETINPTVRKQINTFVKDYHYTYSGILRSLVYFYDIKGNPPSKAREYGGIGIVPYVYENARQYYYALWEAQQKNVNKVLKEYVPKVIEITIKDPQRQIQHRRLFTFLDEEGDE